MDAIKILLVEDDPNDLELLKWLLGQLDSVKIATANNYTLAKELLNQHNFNLLVTDIDLKGIKTGIDLATIANSVYHIPVIFVSAHSTSQLLDQAFAIDPLAYLVKPFKKEDVWTTMRLALHKLPKRHKPIVKEADELVLQNGRNLNRIQLKDTYFIQSKGNYLYFEGNYSPTKVRYTLSEILEKLPDYFIRVQKSFIVNARYITKLTANKVELGKYSCSVNSEGYEQLTQFLTGEK